VDPTVHTWEGYAYERRGGKDNRWKPTEYRYRDKHDRLTIVESRLLNPRKFKGHEVEVVSIIPGFIPHKASTADLPGETAAVTKTVGPIFSY